MSDKSNEKPSFSFTTAVRGTYVHACTAEAFKKNGQAKGDPKYSATFIIDLTDPKQKFDFERLQQEVIGQLKLAYPGKKLVAGRALTQEELDAGAVSVNVPWFKGDREAERLAQKGKAQDGEIYKGKMLVKTSSKYRPALDAIENKKVISFTDDAAIAAAEKKFFYSGAWFVPTFGLNIYPAKGNDNGGVSLYFNGLLFVKNDQRLGGRTHNPAEAYKGYLGSISQEDPTGGNAGNDLDDDIPF